MKYRVIKAVCPNSDTNAPLEEWNTTIMCETDDYNNVFLIRNLLSETYANDYCVFYYINHWLGPLQAEEI